MAAASADEVTEAWMEVFWLAFMVGVIALSLYWNDRS